MASTEDVQNGFSGLSTRIELTNDDKIKSPTVIYGSNQRIYWEGCNVTLNKKYDNDRIVPVKVLAHNGEGVLPEGWVLYITGGNCKVRVVNYRRIWE